MVSLQRSTPTAATPSLPQYVGWTNPTLANYFRADRVERGFLLLQPSLEQRQLVGATIPYVGNGCQGHTNWFSR